MAGHGAYQGPLLALRAQRRIDLPEAARRRRGRADADERGGQVGADGHRLGLVDSLGRLAGKDDVDIADVVEFAAAGLAHGDDRQPCPRRPLPHLVDGQRVRCSQRRLGQVGQRRGDVGQDVGGFRGLDIEGGDGEQLAAVLDAQGVLPRRRVAPTRGPTVAGEVAGRPRGIGCVPRVGLTGRGEHRLGERGDPVLDSDRGCLEDIEDVIGVGDEMVGQRERTPQQPEQALPVGAHLTQPVEDPSADLGRVGTAYGLDDANQPEQRLIRIGGRGQSPRQTGVLDGVTALDQGLETRILEQ